MVLNSQLVRRLAALLGFPWVFLGFNFGFSGYSSMGFFGSSSLGLGGGVEFFLF